MIAISMKLINSDTVAIASESLLLEPLFSSPMYFKGKKERKDDVKEKSIKSGKTIRVFAKCKISKRNRRKKKIEWTQEQRKKRRLNTTIVFMISRMISSTITLNLCTHSHAHPFHWRVHWLRKTNSLFLFPTFYRFYSSK